MHQDDSSRVLADWLDTPFGRYVAAREAVFWEQKQVTAGGARVLQLGLPQWRLLRKQAHNGLALYQHHRLPADVCADPEFLPWPDSSIDGVLLPHGLDVCVQTAPLLAELHRILTPRGCVVFTGLNPGGYWRLGAPAVCRRLNLRSVAQVRQSLGQAGLSVQQGSFMAYAWPWLRRGSGTKPSAVEHMGNRWWPHQAAVYGLVAVKDVLGMHPDAALVQRMCKERVLGLAPAGYRSSERL